MLLLVVSASTAKELSPSCGVRVTSLLLVQKRSNQEKTTPRLRALRASVPAKFAGGLRGLSTAHPVLTPNWFASLRTTLRACPPPTRRFRGAPGRATRILRVLFRRARSTAERHFALAMAFRFSPSAGHDGPQLYPGPLCGGETGTTGRAAGVDTDVDSFSPGQESCRKARPRLTDLPGRSPASAKRGGLSLYSGHPALRPSGRLRRSRRSCGAVVTFLFGHTKRK